MAEREIPQPDEEQIRKLIEACVNAKEKAYAPYSNFRVGAAILTKEGTIITGCNVENCAYPMCTCAERCAVVKAVSEGYKEFTAVAVSTDSEDFCSPCGNCRQILCEFGLKQWVIMAKADKSYSLSTLEELLPKAFTPRHLAAGQKKT